jgi:hypothetical protein
MKKLNSSHTQTQRNQDSPAAAAAAADDDDDDDDFLTCKHVNSFLMHFCDLQAYEFFLDAFL